MLPVEFVVGFAREAITAKSILDMLETSNLTAVSRQGSEQHRSGDLPRPSSGRSFAAGAATPGMMHLLAGARALGKWFWRTTGSTAGLAIAVIALGLSGVQAQTNDVSKVSPETATNRTAKPYLLRPDDVVLVRVYQEDDLETRGIIDNNGMLTLPLLGPVAVGQKTTDETAALIRERYTNGFLVDPQVSVVLAERAKRRFTVMGQVQRPGTYEYPTSDPLNLLQAIAAAGGYTRLAAPSKITLQRVKDGERVVYNLNAEAMSKDKTTKPFEVLPEDVVTVGDRTF